MHIHYTVILWAKYMQLYHSNTSGFTSCRTSWYIPSFFTVPTEAAVLQLSLLKPINNWQTILNKIKIEVKHHYSYIPALLLLNAENLCQAG